MRCFLLFFLLSAKTHTSLTSSVERRLICTNTYILRLSRFQRHDSRWGRDKFYVVCGSPAWNVELTLARSPSAATLPPAPHFLFFVSSQPATPPLPHLSVSQHRNVTANPPNLPRYPCHRHRFPLPFCRRHLVWRLRRHSFRHY